MVEYRTHRFKEFSLPCLIELQGRIADNPDKAIIDRIVREIRNQPPLIETGNCGMVIRIPPVYLWFRTHKEKDFQILVMAFSKKILIHIKQLDRYQDVAWGLIDGEKDLPPDMLQRLQEKRYI